MRKNNRNQIVQRIIDLKPIKIKSIIWAERAGVASELMPKYLNYNSGYPWQRKGSISMLIMEVIS